MEPIDAGPQATLPEFLRARALSSAPHRLALDTIGGAAVAGVAFWARPAGWVVLTAAGTCFAMYGVWAVAERHLQAGVPRISVAEEVAWVVARTSAAGIGLLALALFTFASLGALLGNWIH
ncbi:MAG: hypothetical protein C0497_15040 [Gemmatimonas sp.]|nr:hypothetical protein [Gemmatimonas sp.]